MLNREKCNTCILSDKNKKVCHLNGTPIDLDNDDCSKHTKTLNYCEICRSPVLPTGSILTYDDEERVHLICVNCHKLLSTCQACKKFENCEFENNPDPMPKSVMKTVRQGNMQMQAAVRNEERVKKFCPTCECWDEEIGCLKEFNVGCIKKSQF